jgi:hypothetical protein
MGPILCPETSVKDYHSPLCNIPKERRYQAKASLGLSSSAVSVISLADSVAKLSPGLYLHFATCLVSLSVSHYVVAQKLKNEKHLHEELKLDRVIKKQ